MECEFDSEKGQDYVKPLSQIHLSPEKNSKQFHLLY